VRAALLSVVLGFVLPGSIAYAGGMLGFLLLPLLLGSGIGQPAPVENGVRYVTGKNASRRFDVLARYLGAAAIAAFAWLSMSRDGMIPAIFGILIGNGCALLALVGLYSRVFTPERDAHAITLEGKTLTLSGADGTKVLGYEELEKIEVDQRRIWLVTGTGRHVVDVEGTAELAQALARLIVARPG
jgi:hypothetical protein